MIRTKWFVITYSKKNLKIDWVLDQFMGSGTTLVEAKLLNRHAVGVDINPQSVSISETNLQFRCETNSKIFTRNGNATDYWEKQNNNFLLLAHEYIFVFQK